LDELVVFLAATGNFERFTFTGAAASRTDGNTADEARADAAYRIGVVLYRHLALHVFEHISMNHDFWKYNRQLTNYALVIYLKNNVFHAKSSWSWQRKTSLLLALIIVSMTV
jgi:hypothetical protein